MPITHSEYNAAVEEYGREATDKAMRKIVNQDEIQMRGKHRDGTSGSVRRDLDRTARNNFRNDPERIFTEEKGVRAKGALRGTDFQTLSQTAALISGGGEGGSNVKAGDALVQARAKLNARPFDGDANDVQVRRATQVQRAQQAGLQAKKGGGVTGGGSLFSPVHLARRRLTGGPLLPGGK